MNCHCLPFRLLVSTSLLLLITVPTKYCRADDETNETILESRVTAVTLYRTQALVTRTIELDGEPGAKELVIGDLPGTIDSASLFAEGDDGVEVRAVRYRARAISTSPREEVRELEEEINSIQQKLLVNAKQVSLLQNHGNYLDKLETFTAPTADFDLGRGVLNADIMEQLTKFSFGQRQEIMDAELKLTMEHQDLQKQLSLAKRKMSEIANGSTKQERQAVLFAQKTKAGKQSIRLNYLTLLCGWSPTYTVRAETNGETVRVEYNSLIQQMSGEDWKDVKLTLSTASPALSAAGPGLAPFRLTLTPNIQTPNQQQQMAMGDMGMDMGNIRSLVKMQNKAIRGNRIATSNDDNLKTSWTINNAVNNVDCFAITSEAPISALKFDNSGEGGEEPALSYEIKSPVSLPSRNHQQMVRVLVTDLESEFYHIATPVLTSYVYREAELNNNSQEDLMAGPLTVYLDGRFVGRSEIPTVARGQSFVVGLGADPQLRSRRELIKKSNLINGGNRETKLAYKLIINNYKETPANIRVVDRMPIVEEESDIRVTLDEEVEGQLSKDGVYVRTLLPKGILRWDAKVAGRSMRESSHEIEYSYTLEYDRNYSVSLPENVKEQESEYQKMENSRRGGTR